MNLIDDDMIYLTAIG